MAISIFELTLQGFSFPDELPNNRANFRFVVDLRLIQGGKFKTETVIMPGFDTWWECDLRKRRQPEYVRQAGGPAFNMKRIDDWERLVLLTKAEALHSLQVKVFDVDRPGFWDNLGGAFSRVVQTALGRARDALPVADLATEGFGLVEEDLRSTVAKRLAGGDKLLFRGSKVLKKSGDFSIRGAGVDGEYVLAFNLTSQ